MGMKANDGRNQLFYRYASVRNSIHRLLLMTVMEMGAEGACQLQCVLLLVCQHVIVLA